MKKSYLLIFAVICLFLLFSGCAKTEPKVSQEPDLVVATVDGAEILRSQVEKLAAGSDQAYDSVTGMSEEEISQKKLESRLGILENLIMDKIISAKIAEHGITETPAMSEAAEKSWENAVAAMERYVLASYPTLSGTELEDTVTAMLKAQGIDKDTLIKNAIDDQLEKALSEKLAAALPAPDSAQLEEYYNQLLTQQKELFESNMQAYESALLSGELVLYRPADCKAVKQLYFKFDDDVIDLIKQLESVKDKETADEMRADQYTIMDETLAAVAKAIAQGVDFDTIASKYDIDDANAVNYITAASTRFGSEYMAALAGITAQGGFSQPVKQEYGYIIIYWDSTLPAGTLSLEEAQQPLSQQLSASLAEEYYQLQLENWRTAAKVEIFKDKLK